MDYFSIWENDKGSTVETRAESDEEKGMALG
jgi:hypothetical protein